MHTNLPNVDEPETARGARSQMIVACGNGHRLRRGRASEVNVFHCIGNGRWGSADEA